jgi:uncharacterized 2Fe-2S/4Fe-4S cluster protein (DUF4445 family)
MDERSQSRIEITFEPSGRRVNAAPGATVMQAARQGGVSLASDCGGRGTCGRCRVRLLAGEVSPAGEDEQAWLTLRELQDGHRLACCCHLRSDAAVHVPPHSRTAEQRLQLDGGGRRAAGEPVIRAVALQGPAPTLDDARCDTARLTPAAADDARGRWRIEPAVVRRLSPLARRWDYRLTGYLRGDRLVGVAAPAARPVGLALDVGTTKIAGYLLDLDSGRQLAARGVMNPQIAYGEDVIQRLDHALVEPGGARVLADCVWREIDALLGWLCDRAGVEREQVAEVCAVGNTACMHLLLELPVAQLAASPFVPACCAPLELPAREVGLGTAVGARLYTPPCIGGFVGADCAAVLLAAELDRAAAVTAAVDIGTNTEIALAVPGRDALLATSCASGPAFEGAHIHQGMRAAPGAVESVRLEEDGVQMAVIGDVPASGICGSGVVAALAELVRRGGIDRRGHLRRGFAGVRAGAQGRELLLVAAAAGGAAADIVLTQRDVEAIQLAKAAVRSGFDALLEHAGVAAAEVERVVMAGAFGCHLPLAAVLDIGMFPPLPRATFEPAGNAAGQGAKLMLLSADERRRAQAVARRTRFVELKTTPGFNQRFARALRFSPGQPEKKNQ